MRFNLINKFQMNNRPLLLARTGILVFVLISAMFLLLFLYKSFYQTIVYANEVIILKQEVALEDIDLNEFNRIFETHEYKITPILGKNIPDPFYTENYIAPKEDETAEIPTE